jgi:hypothetical protein
MKIGGEIFAETIFHPAEDCLPQSSSNHALKRHQYALPCSLEQPACQHHPEVTLNLVR